MFFRATLVTAATLAAGAIAALPAPGRYHIVNQETGRRFDVWNFRTAPNPIRYAVRLLILCAAEQTEQVLGYPPNKGDNQKWDIAQESTEGESGFYTFTAVSPVRKAFVNAQNVGNGVTSELFGATFNVTEVGTAGGFTITVPLTNPLLAVTTTANATQLTLEVHDTANDLQVWAFQAVE